MIRYASFGGDPAKDPTYDLVQVLRDYHEQIDQPVVILKLEDWRYTLFSPSRN